MKACLPALLLTLSLRAAAQSADELYKRACGPVNAAFNVQLLDTELAKPQPPAAPEPGKARVYFIQKEAEPTYTTRIGLDGSWVGVVLHDSYIAVAVEPGEHHACAATLNRKKREAELIHFTLEAGKTYYYLVHGVVGTGGQYGATYATMLFGPVDSDEALLLIASNPRSEATPKP